MTKGVPCHKRLDQYAGDAGFDESVVESGRGGKGDDDGWLRTGGNQEGKEGMKMSAGDVRTVDEMGQMEERVVDEDEIPDMEDEEDDEDAIIRDTNKRDDNS